MDKKFNVALIGAGNIGAVKEYSLDNPKTKKPLTHAHAIYNDDRFILDLVIDKDQQKLNAAALRWLKTPLFKCSTNLSAIHDCEIDVIVVAVPTKIHFQTLLDIVSTPSKRLKLVIVEKPFCWTSGEAAIIKKLYDSLGIKLLINYNRRYSMSYNKILMQHLKNEEVQNVTVRYNRGLKHDGCHAIDILNWWFGRCTAISLNDSIEPILDYPEGGRSYSISLKYERCPSAIFMPMDYKVCGIFEMDIITSKNRHILANYGEYVINFEIKNNETYGHKNTFNWELQYYANDVEKIKCHSAFLTDLHYTLKNLYDVAYNILTNQSNEYNCTAADAIRVHNIVEHVDMLYEKKAL